MEKYYGLFKRVKENYPEFVNECPLYYEEAAELYDQISMAYDHYDDYFYEQAVLSGGPVLELCCGSGRITMKLAKAGFDITAVDLSEDMLANLKQQLEGNYRRVKKNVKFIAADMNKLELEERFNLIIIGATSIRLMENDFTAFFNKMYDLLKDGGSLFFDFEDMPILTNKGIEEGPMTVCDLKDRAGRLSILCMQRSINYSEKRAFVDFLKITHGTEGKALLSHTDYRIFGAEDIKRAAVASAFGSCIITKSQDQNNNFCKMVRK